MIFFVDCVTWGYQRNVNNGLSLEIKRLEFSENKSNNIKKHATKQEVGHSRMDKISLHETRTLWTSY